MTSTTNRIARRKALTAVAAMPVAVALGAVLTPAVTKAAPQVYKFGIGEGPRSFGYPVVTDQYEPEFPKGSIAIIDPDLALLPRGRSPRGCRAHRADSLHARGVC
jgi:hypothetical protein